VGDRLREPDATSHEQDSCEDLGRREHGREQRRALSQPAPLSSCATRGHESDREHERQHEQTRQPMNHVRLRGPKAWPELTGAEDDILILLAGSPSASVPHQRAQQDLREDRQGGG